MLAVLLAALFFVQPPPKRFDYPPKLPVHVIEASSAKVHKMCRLLSGYRGSGQILACAIPRSNGCLIIWPRGMKRAGVLWRHERAHCNNWPGHHPA